MRLIMDRDPPEMVRSAQLLEEAEQTLRAIQYGGVDAFVIEEPEGHRVYTLEGSDLPYSMLVERMEQGAAMLDARGFVVYSNLSLAQLFGVSREAIVGRLLQDFLSSADQSLCQKLLREAQSGSSEGEMLLRLSDDREIPAHFSFSLLSRHKSARSADHGPNRKETAGRIHVAPA